MLESCSGALTALLTPCDDDGRIDFAAIHRLVDEQVSRGIVGLFVLGTAGQGPMMTTDERMKVLEAIMAAVDGRISVIAHVGAMPTPAATALAAHAKNVGVTAMASVPPVYYRPDKIAVRSYYAALRDTVGDLPLLAYNNPSATGYTISPLEAFDLMAAGTIDGVKQATALIAEANHLIELGVPTWMANADLNLAAVTMGAHGTISTITNVVPEPFVALFNAVQDGDIAAARHHQGVIDFVAPRLRNPTIGGLHAGAALRGWPAGQARRPLRPPREEENVAIAEAVERVLQEYT